jgi:beta-lactamase class D
MRTFFIFLLLALLGSACTFNNVKENKELESFFTAHQVKGCFAIMDNGTGQFITYNLSHYRDSSYAPFETFEIIRSLVALQAGVLNTDSLVLQEGAYTLGKDTVQAWLDSLGYGARNDKERFKIRSAATSFWSDNALTVTPDAQLGLIKQLYFGQLPFFKTYQEMVKRKLMKEDNTLYRLGYQTGQGVHKNGKSLGWTVGWIEENNHASFFVLQLESETPRADLRDTGVQVTKELLKKVGFFAGNR